MVVKMSCRCRLRRNECDVVIGLALGRQCLGYDAGNTRSVSLALGFDRAAGGGLCRSTVFQKRMASCSLATTQYGRADHGWRHIGARLVALSDRNACSSRLFRFRDHAVV